MIFLTYTDTDISVSVYIKSIGLSLQVEVENNFNRSEGVNTRIPMNKYMKECSQNRLHGQSCAEPELLPLLPKYYKLVSVRGKFKMFA